MGAVRGRAARWTRPDHHCRARAGCRAVEQGSRADVEARGAARSGPRPRRGGLCRTGRFHHPRPASTRDRFRRRRFGRLQRGVRGYAAGHRKAAGPARTAARGHLVRYRRGGRAADRRVVAEPAGGGAGRHRHGCRLLTAAPFAGVDGHEQGRELETGCGTGGLHLVLGSGAVRLGPGYRCHRERARLSRRVSGRRGLRVRRRGHGLHDSAIGHQPSGRGGGR